MTKFFQEAPGVNSLTRVVFFMLICYAIIQTSLGLFILEWDVGGAVAFFGTIAGVATGGKLLQKTMEVKDGIS
jgi:hypothetical protein